MEERLVLKKSVKNLIQKVFIMTIGILIGMILTKNNESLKNDLKKEIYETSYPIIENRNIYEKYFSFLNKEKVKQVSNNIFSYIKREDTKEGVKLTVKENTPIPLLESGIIVYLENSRVIIEQTDGVKAIYESINTNNKKLYDYLEKGEILGESISDTIILSFTKKGEYYDYKKYL